MLATSWAPLTTEERWREHAGVQQTLHLGKDLLGRETAHVLVNQASRLLLSHLNFFTMVLATDFVSS